MTSSEILALLKKQSQADAKLGAFGASDHEYKLNPPLPKAELEAFEAKHQIKLPEQYRNFLTEIGNGGAGPYYGLFPLGLFDGSGGPLVKWKPGDGFAGVLKENFPHSTGWNFSDEQFEQPDFSNEEEEHKWFEAHDEKYWAADLVNGAFPICHQGCAYRNLLIVTGPERGNVWLDARASDGGIQPESTTDRQRLTFLEWYILWLQNPSTF